jgi:hypothetical protein
VDDVVGGGQITSSRWVELREHYSQSMQLEITAVIATWHYVSVLVRSLQVPLDEGMAAWPPDGIGPPSVLHDHVTTAGDTYDT